MYDEDFYGQCECGHKVKVILLRMDRGHTSTLLILQSLIAAHHNFDIFSFDQGRDNVGVSVSFQRGKEGV